MVIISLHQVTCAPRAENKGKKSYLLPLFAAVRPRLSPAGDQRPGAWAGHVAHIAPPYSHINVAMWKFDNHQRIENGALRHDKTPPRNRGGSRRAR